MITTAGGGGGRVVVVVDVVVVVVVDVVVVVELEVVVTGRRVVLELGSTALGCARARGGRGATVAASAVVTNRVLSTPPVTHNRFGTVRPVRRAPAAEEGTRSVVWASVAAVTPATAAADGPSGSIAPAPALATCRLRSPPSQ